eukprot:TRINITY_DN10734_c0_g3_i2.p1 TRINITY_DN10734_c0_g3~~TRINITY_DN10734_c0_g3_i2.p1  ORF type:complete len:3764 (-),score=1062.52 TRINITY_DN10734_c0_g3_i2:343-11634(-)
MSETVLPRKSLAATKGKNGSGTLLDSIVQKESNSRSTAVTPSPSKVALLVHKACNWMVERVSERNDSQAWRWRVRRLNQNIVLHRIERQVKSWETWATERVHWSPPFIEYRDDGMERVPGVWSLPSGLAITVSDAVAATIHASTLGGNRADWGLFIQAYCDTFKKKLKVVLYSKEDFRNMTSQRQDLQYRFKHVSAAERRFQKDTKVLAHDLGMMRGEAAKFETFADAWSSKEPAFQTSMKYSHMTSDASLAARSLQMFRELGKVYKSVRKLVDAAQAVDKHTGQVRKAESHRPTQSLDSQRSAGGQPAASRGFGMQLLRGATGRGNEERTGSASKESLDSDREMNAAKREKNLKAKYESKEAQEKRVAMLMQRRDELKIDLAHAGDLANRYANLVKLMEEGHMKLQRHTTDLTDACGSIDSMTDQLEGLIGPQVHAWVEKRAAGGRLPNEILSKLEQEFAQKQGPSERDLLQRQLARLSSVLTDIERESDVEKVLKRKVAELTALKNGDQPELDRAKSLGMKSTTSGPPKKLLQGTSNLVAFTTEAMFMLPPEELECASQLWKSFRKLEDSGTELDYAARDMQQVEPTEEVERSVRHWTQSCKSYVQNLEYFAEMMEFEELPQDLVKMAIADKEEDDLVRRTIPRLPTAETLLATPASGADAQIEKLRTVQTKMTEQARADEEQNVSKKRANEMLIKELKEACVGLAAASATAPPREAKEAPQASPPKRAQTKEAREKDAKEEEQNAGMKLQMQTLKADREKERAALQLEVQLLEEELRKLMNSTRSGQGLAQGDASPRRRPTAGKVAVVASAGASAAWLATKSKETSAASAKAAGDAAIKAAMQSGSSPEEAAKAARAAAKAAGGSGEAADKAARQAAATVAVKNAKSPEAAAEQALKALKAAGASEEEWKRAAVEAATQVALATGKSMEEAGQIAAKAAKKAGSDATATAHVVMDATWTAVEASGKSKEQAATDAAKAAEATGISKGQLMGVVGRVAAARFSDSHKTAAAAAEATAKLMKAARGTHADISSAAGQAAWAFASKAGQSLEDSAKATLAAVKASGGSAATATKVVQQLATQTATEAHLSLKEAVQMAMDATKAAGGSEGEVLSAGRSAAAVAAACSGKDPKAAAEEAAQMAKAVGGSVEDVARAAGQAASRAALAAGKSVAEAAKAAAVAAKKAGGSAECACRVAAQEAARSAAELGGSTDVVAAAKAAAAAVGASKDVVAKCAGEAAADLATAQGKSMDEVAKAAAKATQAAGGSAADAAKAAADSASRAAAASGLSPAEAAEAAVKAAKQAGCNEKAVAAVAGEAAFRAAMAAGKSPEDAAKTVQAAVKAAGGSVADAQNIAAEVASKVAVEEGKEAEEIGRIVSKVAVASGGSKEAAAAAAEQAIKRATSSGKSAEAAAKAEAAGGSRKSVQIAADGADEEPSKRSPTAAQHHGHPTSPTGVSRTRTSRMSAPTVPEDGGGGDDDSDHAVQSRQPSMTHKKSDSFMPRQSSDRSRSESKLGEKYPNEPWRRLFPDDAPEVAREKYEFCRAHKVEYKQLLLPKKQRGLKFKLMRFVKQKRRTLMLKKKILMSFLTDDQKAMVEMSESSPEAEQKRLQVHKAELARLADRALRLDKLLGFWRRRMGVFDDDVRRKREDSKKEVERILGQLERLAKVMCWTELRSRKANGVDVPAHPLGPPPQPAARSSLEQQPGAAMDPRQSPQPSIGAIELTTSRNFATYTRRASSSEPQGSPPPEREAAEMREAPQDPIIKKRALTWKDTVASVGYNVTPQTGARQSTLARIANQVAAALQNGERQSTVPTDEEACTMYLQAVSTQLGTLGATVPGLTIRDPSLSDILFVHLDHAKMRRSTDGPMECAPLLREYLENFMDAPSKMTSLILDFFAGLERKRLLQLAQASWDERGRMKMQAVQMVVKALENLKKRLVQREAAVGMVEGHNPRLHVKEALARAGFLSDMVTQSDSDSGLSDSSEDRQEEILHRRTKLSLSGNSLLGKPAGSKQSLVNRPSRSTVSKIRPSDALLMSGKEPDRMTLTTTQLLGTKEAPMLPGALLDNAVSEATPADGSPIAVKMSLNLMMRPTAVFTQKSILKKQTMKGTAAGGTSADQEKKADGDEAPAAEGEAEGKPVAAEATVEKKAVKVGFAENEEVVQFQGSEEDDGSSESSEAAKETSAPSSPTSAKDSEGRQSVFKRLMLRKFASEGELGEEQKTGEQGGDDAPADVVPNMFAAMFAARFAEKALANRARTASEDKVQSDKWETTCKSFERLKSHLVHRKMLNHKHEVALEKYYTAPTKLRRSTSVLGGMLEQTEDLQHNAARRTINRSRTAFLANMNNAIIGTLGERAKRYFQRRQSNTGAHLLTIDQQEYWAAVKEAVRESKSSRLQEQQDRVAAMLADLDESTAEASGEHYTQRSMLTEKARMGQSHMIRKDLAMDMRKALDKRTQSEVHTKQPSPTARRRRKRSTKKMQSDVLAGLTSAGHMLDKMIFGELDQDHSGSDDNDGSPRSPASEDETDHEEQKTKAHGPRRKGGANEQAEKDKKSQLPQSLKHTARQKKRHLMAEGNEQPRPEQMTLNPGGIEVRVTEAQSPGPQDGVSRRVSKDDWSVGYSIGRADSNAFDEGAAKGHRRASKDFAGNHHHRTVHLGCPITTAVSRRNSNCEAGQGAVKRELSLDPNAFSRQLIVATEPLVVDTADALAVVGPTVSITVSDATPAKAPADDHQKRKRDKHLTTQRLAKGLVCRNRRNSADMGDAKGGEIRHSPQPGASRAPSRRVSIQSNGSRRASREPSAQVTRVSSKLSALLSGSASSPRRASVESFKDAASDSDGSSTSSDWVSDVERLSQRSADTPGEEEAQASEEEEEQSSGEDVEPLQPSQAPRRFRRQGVIIDSKLRLQICGAERELRQNLQKGGTALEERLGVPMRVVVETALLQDLDCLEIVLNMSHEDIVDTVDGILQALEAHYLPQDCLSELHSEPGSGDSGKEDIRGRLEELTLTAQKILSPKAAGTKTAREVQDVADHLRAGLNALSSKVTKEALAAGLIAKGRVLLQPLVPIVEPSLKTAKVRRTIGREPDRKPAKPAVVARRNKKKATLESLRSSSSKSLKLEGKPEVVVRKNGRKLTQYGWMRMKFEGMPETSTPRNRTGSSAAGQSTPSNPWGRLMQLTEEAASRVPQEAEGDPPSAFDLGMLRSRLHSHVEKAFKHHVELWSQWRVERSAEPSDDEAPQAPEPDDAALEKGDEVVTAEPAADATDQNQTHGSFLFTALDTEEDPRPEAQSGDDKGRDDKPSSERYLMTTPAAAEPQIQVSPGTSCSTDDTVRGAPAIAQRTPDDDSPLLMPDFQQYTNEDLFLAPQLSLQGRAATGSGPPKKGPAPLPLSARDPKTRVVPEIRARPSEVSQLPSLIGTKIGSNSARAAQHYLMSGFDPGNLDAVLNMRASTSLSSRPSTSLSGAAGGPLGSPPPGWMASTGLKKSLHPESGADIADIPKAKTMLPEIMGAASRSTGTPLSPFDSWRRTDGDRSTTTWHTQVSTTESWRRALASTSSSNLVTRAKSPGWMQRGVKDIGGVSLDASAWAQEAAHKASSNTPRKLAPLKHREATDLESPAGFAMDKAVEDILMGEVEDNQGALDSSPPRTAGTGGEVGGLLANLCKDLEAQARETQDAWANMPVRTVDMLHSVASAAAAAAATDASRLSLSEAHASRAASASFDAMQQSLAAKLAPHALRQDVWSKRKNASEKSTVPTRSQVHRGRSAR